MEEFENLFAKLIKNVKFGRKSNHFQDILKQDEKKIKAEERVIIKADKSTNYYKMEAEEYKELVEKEIHKEYRKSTKEEIKEVENSQKTIVKNLELEDRVFETTQQQCFATIKDHKAGKYPS